MRLQLFIIGIATILNLSRAALIQTKKTCNVMIPTIKCQANITRLATGVYSSPLPGVWRRCNKTRDCLVVLPRYEQFSTNFLCCEAGGWVATHIIVPMILYVFTRRATLTLLLTFYWEVIEALFITFDTLFLERKVSSGDGLLNDGLFESLAGSLIADAFIGGALGVFLGFLFVQVTQIPDFFPPKISSPSSQKTIAMITMEYETKSAEIQRQGELEKERKNRTKNIMTEKLWIKNVVLLLFIFAMNLVIIPLVEPPSVAQSQVNGDRIFIYYTFYYLFLFIALIPCCMSTRWDFALVWSPKWNAFKRFFAFSLFCLIVVSLQFSVLSIAQFAPNDYYQAWIVSSIWIVLFLIFLMGEAILKQKLRILYRKHKL
jgi:hypothetical protein